MSWLIGVSALWALSFGLIKGRLTGLDPALVSTVRLALACLAFLPFARLRGVPARTRAQLAAVGAIQFGLMYVLYISSYRYLAAWQVALLSVTTPVHVALLHMLAKRRLAAVPLALAALAVVAAGLLQPTTGAGSGTWLGVALVQASNACFALGQVWFRTMRLRGLAVSDLGVMAWMYAAGAALAAAVALMGGGFAHLASITPQAGMTLLYLGVVASGVGFYGWNHGASRVSGATLAVMNNFKAPLAVAASLFIFGESADPVRLLGASVLMLLAVVAAQRCSAPRASS